jgi:hypothetical protein
MPHWKPTGAKPFMLNSDVPGAKIGEIKRLRLPAMTLP